MKTKFIIQLFLLAFVSLSLYSCTADTVDEAAQQNKVTPTVLSPVADDDPTIAEPELTNPK